MCIEKPIEDIACHKIIKYFCISVLLVIILITISCDISNIFFFSYFYQYNF